ncbi:hypothetical protein SAMN06296952_2183 [Oscillospiraceae bacterium]|nr:hypothetical protein SAMN06296952_2183 [Oscillospiraceae bacterium]
MGYEIVKYDPSCIWDNNSSYYPVFVIIRRKLYRVQKWNELFQLLLFSYCYRTDNMELVRKAAGSLKYSYRNKAFIQSGVEESAIFSKFAPYLYVRSFFPLCVNCGFLDDINEFVEDSELNVYLVRCDQNDEVQSYKEAIDSFVRDYKDEYGINSGSTKHLIAHINGKVLSNREKFFRRIVKEFNSHLLIGDIVINDEEELILKSFMKEAISNIIQESSISHEEVFAFGLVYVARKCYETKTYWPYLESEYSIKIPANCQSKINDEFRSIMCGKKKLYDNTQTSFIQNICMHAFICDRCSDQLFNYLFDFWRIDLSKSIENVSDDFGNNLFDILIDEISEGAQNVMVHTMMALKLNPGGCKNRLRRLLKMIDKSFWYDADYSESTNRITRLFETWKKSSTSSFYKEYHRSEKERKRGRGEKLLSSPVIIYKPSDNGFKVLLPQQLLRHCSEDERPIWTITIGSESRSVEPTLLQGKFLFTNETDIRIRPDQLFEDIEVELKSDKRSYYRRVIRSTDVRFFNSKFRNIEAIADCLSKDVSCVFTVKGCKLRFITDAKVDVYDNLSEYDVYSFALAEGDIILFPDNKAIAVGRSLNEGILNDRSTHGAYVLYDEERYAITASLDKVFFKANRSKINGTSIKVIKNGDQVYFGRVVDKEYIGFKLSELVEENYGYIFDLKNYIAEDGLYRIELDIPRIGIRTYKFCYIDGFDYQYIGAPYIFKPTGRIAFPRELAIVAEDELIFEDDIQILEFSLDEDSRNGNSYVKDHKLNLRYDFDEECIAIQFDLPVLYWKYASVEQWNINKPQDMMRKRLPKHIYVSGDLDFESSIMFISQADDLEESEIHINQDKDTGLYYFRSLDINSFLNRERLKRSLYIKVNDKSEHFFDITCRSEVRSAELSGDFNKNVIYGYFDVYGDSEYVVTVEHKGVRIEEDVPLKDGKFEISCELEQGDYSVHVYEIEEDDSGFDAIAVEIGVYKLSLIDLRCFEGETIDIKSIKNRNRQLSDLSFVGRYCITNLKLIDYNRDIGDGELYSWIHNPDDNQEMSSFVYYEGQFGFVKRDTGKFVNISKAIVVFDNYKNTNEVLINLFIDGIYNGLEYSPDKAILQPDASKMSRYERKRRIMIDDDLYKICVKIGGVR